MKKILIAFITFFLFNLNTYAANAVMRCDYNAKIVDETVYLKYRVTYYDDNTIKRYIATNGGSDVAESNVKTHLNVTTFSVKDNNPYSMIMSVGDNFTADNMKQYYEKKVCPYLAFNYENYTITPVEDTSLNGGAYSTNVAEGNTLLFNSSGNETPAPKPNLNKECDYHIKNDTLKNVEGITANFSLYDNGEKYFKVYFSDKGEGSGQKILIGNTDVVARLQTDKGIDYSIILPIDQVSKIYNQNNAQMEHNTFACIASTNLYLIEKNFSERIYEITTDKELADNYGDHTGNMNEGVDNDPGGFESNIDIDFDTTKGCESYLGNPKDNVNKPPAYYLQFAFNLIKYIALILLLVLTIIEYAKAIASSNQDAIKKATMNTIKRIIIAVIIFVLPMLIEFLFKILGIYSSTTCGIR